MPAWLKTVLGGAAIVGVIAAILLGVRCHEKNVREPFDADRYLASGMAEAMEHGAELASLEATYVTPDARVHSEYGGTLRISWVAVDRDPDETAVMPGAPRKGGGAKCSDYWMNVHVDESADVASLDDDMSVNHNMSCWNRTAPGPLFCTIKAIWDRAIAAGAPNPALATIKLETRDDKTRRWTLTIVDNVEGGAKKTLFSGEYADDCSPRVER